MKLKDTKVKTDKQSYMEQIDQFYNRGLPSNREIIESIPDEIRNPIIVVKDKERNTLALICRGVDQGGNHLLVALQLNSILYGNEINEIKSIYGKEHLLEYLGKQNIENVYAINKERAKMLSPSIGFRLPESPIKS